MVNVAFSFNNKVSASRLYPGTRIAARHFWSCPNMLIYKAPPFSFWLKSLACSRMQDDQGGANSITRRYGVPNQ
jgi:hypothetical protein